MKTQVTIELERMEWVAGEEVQGVVSVSFKASNANETEGGDVVVGIVLTAHGTEAVQWQAEKGAILSNKKDIYLRQQTIDVRLPMLAGT